jgi:hypothetical protein
MQVVFKLTNSKGEKKAWPISVTLPNSSALSLLLTINEAKKLITQLNVAIRAAADAKVDE